MASRFSLDPDRILFEDADLLAVDKPSGLVAHATVDPRRDHLIAATSRFLADRDGTIGHLRMHHRLDRETSGVVLFSRSPTVDAALGSAFSERRVLKVYLAVVHCPASATPPPAAVVVRNYLAPGRGPAGRTVVVRAGGKPAETSVRVLARGEDLALVEARPHTGRTHQIRVHLAELGLPIAGDTLYGSAPHAPGRLLLHAARLELAHPRDGNALRIAAPVPAAFAACFPAAIEHDDGIAR
jgi:RluA family pseudouridine synthase